MTHASESFGHIPTLGKTGPKRQRNPLHYPAPPDPRQDRIARIRTAVANVQARNAAARPGVMHGELLDVTEKDVETEIAIARTEMLREMTPEVDA